MHLPTLEPHCDQCNKAASVRRIPRDDGGLDVKIRCHGQEIAFYVTEAGLSEENCAWLSRNYKDVFVDIAPVRYPKAGTFDIIEEFKQMSRNGHQPPATVQKFIRDERDRMWRGFRPICNVCSRSVDSFRIESHQETRSTTYWSFCHGERWCQSIHDAMLIQSTPKQLLESLRYAF